MSARASGGLRVLVADNFNLQNVYLERAGDGQFIPGLCFHPRPGNGDHCRSLRAELLRMYARDVCDQGQLKSQPRRVADSPLGQAISDDSDGKLTSDDHLFPILLTRAVSCSSEPFNFTETCISEGRL